MKDIGNRMKQNYESRYKIGLTRRTPVIIRVDGRAFHTLTKGCRKPFDEQIMDAMVHGAMQVATLAQGCKLAYVQSDEASFLLTDYDTLQTEPWFGYDLCKMVSVSAALMTKGFNSWVQDYHYSLGDFDGRAFNLPEAEVANYFVWRAKDWERNSLQMYCQSMFSHRELHGKNRAAMHEMLHGRGKNWATDLNNREKNGTFLILRDRGFHETHLIEPNYEAISKVVESVLP